MSSEKFREGYRDESHVQAICKRTPDYQAICLFNRGVAKLELLYLTMLRYREQPMPATRSLLGSF